MQALAPPAIHDGRFVASDSGLWIPRNYHNNQVTHLLAGTNEGIINDRGFNSGVPLVRDEKTMIVRWFRKGSGVDDYFNDAIADGTVGNVGIAPIIAPVLTSVLQNQVMQAGTASIELTGRKSTVRKAREAISRFNDSPLGATDGIQQIVRNLRTYNRGAPIATVPVHYDMGKWEQYGMEAIPLKLEGTQTKQKKELFYLNVDWKKAGGPVPFLPSVFDLEPTGMTEFPYWYRATEGKDRKWVLLHRTQCIPLVPGKSKFYGIGTSSVWMCIKHIAEEVLEDDRRIELMVNALADGLLGIGPVYMSAEQLKNSLEQSAEDAERQGNILVKGYHILAGPEAPEFNEFNLRKDSGIEFKDRKESIEDHVARAFQEPLSAVATRGGVGFGSQAGTVADQNASGGVEAILSMITVSLGTIFPRVQVTVKRKNDLAQRLNIQTLKTYSESFKNMNSTPAGVVISAEMARATIDREIIDLPSTVDGVIHTTSTNDEDASQENQVSNENQEAEDRQEPAEPRDENLARMFTIVRNFEPLVPDGADDPLPQVESNPDVVSTSEFDYYWDDEDYPGLLDSRVFEQEADVEDDTEGRWAWIAGAWVYLMLATRDRRVDRTESVSIRNTMVVQRQPVRHDLTEDLIAGRITIQTYARAGWNLFQEGNTNAYRLGRGGLRAMTGEDDLILNTMLDDERSTWTSFVQQIASGRYSEDEIRNYSRGFVNASTTFYERGNAESYGLPVLPQYPGDGQTRCHKGCQCYLSILSLPGNGNFDVRWLLGLAEHCPDCLRLAREWNPLRIRNGIIL